MKGLESEFTEYLSQMGKGLGMQDLMLKVFAVLYIEPDEIAMEDIARKTGYSLASISNTMKLLESMGAIKRIRKPKTKKVFFYMDKDLVRWNIMKIDFFHRGILKPAKEKLPEMIKRYDKKTKTDKEKKKLKVVKNYLDYILVFEDLMKRWKQDLEDLRDKNGDKK